MILTPTQVDGAFLVDAEPHADERGLFARLWDAREFSAAGLAGELAQCNLAVNARAGTLRGLHLQREPHADVKLVRCTRGAIYDVVVDLRPGSPTYLRWLGVELDERSRRALYVPAGCAHGYQTLEDGTETLYLHSAPYVPELERGVRWDDPALAIEWPTCERRIVSDKDRSWPDLVPVPA